VSIKERMAATSFSITTGTCQVDYCLGKINCQSKKHSTEPLIVKRINSRYLDAIVSELTILSGVDHPQIIKPEALYFLAGLNQDKQIYYQLDIILQQGIPLLDYLRHH